MTYYEWCLLMWAFASGTVGLIEAAAAHRRLDKLDATLAERAKENGR